MKITLITLALSSVSLVASALEHGQRRALDLSAEHSNGHGHSHHFVRRNTPRNHRSLSSSSSTSRMKVVKRSPLAGSALGAVPVLSRGIAPIVGLVERDAAVLGAHNGEVGSHAGDSSSSGGSTSTTPVLATDSTDDDTEDCDGEDDDDDTTTTTDDADADECDAEDDDEDGDEEDCEDEDDTTTVTAGDDDDDEDCEEEDDDEDTTSSSSSTPTSTSSADTSSVTAKVQQNNKVGPSSTSSSSSWSASASSSSGSGTKTSSAPQYTGTATWFTQNGNAGNCGKVNPDSAKVIALYTSLYGDGSYCGKQVKIDNLDDGTSVIATVADSCPSCSNENNIDLSIGAFQAIDPNYKNDGVRNIAWSFI